LIYSSREETVGLIYSSREETVGLVYSSCEGTTAWFTAVVRERPLGLQQSIDFQLSMVVIVFYLIRTGSNLYSRGVHYFCFCTQKSGLRSQNHCLLPRENSHNQPQQAKAVSAQKSSNLTEKVRHLQDIFR
jgi:hypothetical protein